MTRRRPPGTPLNTYKTWLPQTASNLHNTDSLQRFRGCRGGGGGGVRDASLLVDG
jgi:hypothetical protein